MGTAVFGAFPVGVTGIPVTGEAPVSLASQVLDQTITVRHGGFSAASRATGIEKSRLMSTHPKVAVVIDASDRVVNVVEERFDIALQATTRIDESLELVSRLLGQAYPILVASPNYLQRHGRPDSINDLNDFATICTLADFAHEQGRWGLMRDQAEPLLIHHTPTLITDDLRVQLEATVHGTGIALLPEPLVSASIHEGLLERILPTWVGTPTGLSLTYPSPRGILPAVRSLIDYLSLHIPTAIQQRVIYAEAGRGLTECGSA